MRAALEPAAPRETRPRLAEADRRVGWARPTEPNAWARAAQVRVTCDQPQRPLEASSSSPGLQLYSTEAEVQKFDA